MIFLFPLSISFTMPRNVISGVIMVYINESHESNPVDFTFINPLPQITSISPEIIYPGTEITLIGNNFGTYGDYGISCALCKVKVNNTSITSYIYSSDWSDTSISFTMPYNATSGYITVVDKNGYESNKFNFTLTPKVSSCITSDWSCGSWSACSSSGSQNRTCSKISGCSGGVSSPATTQSCTYTPACSADTWQCGSWGTCSPQGIQTRSCNKTYDCPSAETAAPATSQYCESSYQQNYQTPSADFDIVTNQDTIIKATVKLICPVSSTMASQGSGTVINSTGLILTNKHVIDGTSGCLDDYDDEPYFGDRQIADIYKISSDADVAVLKLRNPSNTTLASINISQSNSGNIKLGEILTTYGYPAKFGTKITYTSGDFSGVDGSYLKTTAIIEHGNSGGGAYLKNGTFIGIPTAVVKGSLNSMGYLLSVSKVNSWLGNSPIVYNSDSSNNYSRVSSILENIDLNTLNTLDLYIAEDSSTAQSNSTTNNSSVGKNLQSRVKGYILLQVESHGEAWYVNPKTGYRHYMKDGAAAYSLMRFYSLGITNADLEKISVGEL